jgi:hypothetical protein
MEMKFVAPLAAAALLSAGAFAQEPNPRRLTKDEMAERCKVIEILAESMMAARQSGKKMSEVRETISNMISIPEGREIAELILIDAYERPRAFGEELQKRAVEDFRDGHMLSCLKSARSPD